jgi:cytoskeletal protein CcmA (bactofilin family)
VKAPGGDTLKGFVYSDCAIRGELEYNTNFLVDGRIEGTVRSQAELVVGDGGAVEGEIEVARCVIGGEVRGVIRATEQVLLHATAKVWADIQAPALVMEDGAFLEGSVSMDTQSVKKNTTKADVAS